MPGTAFLAILSGPLFGGVPGFIMSHLCSVIGACICYFISKKLGAGFVQARMPNKRAWLQNKIDENRHNLLYYFMFLRLTPIVPNWFLNASSAVVGVPFHIFSSTTFIGLLPYSVILVRTGLMLDSITTVGIDPSVSTNSTHSECFEFGSDTDLPLEHAYTFRPRILVTRANVPHQKRRQNGCSKDRKCICRTC